MPTSDVKVTPGVGVNVGTYDITEDAETKKIQRVHLDDNLGNPKAIPSIAKIIQKISNMSSGSVASLAQAFASNNIAGNSIIVVCAVGNGTAPTVSDSAGNTYTQATQIANGTALNVAIFFAVNVIVGANTVTVTNGGTTASIAMEIYEVSGLINQVSAQPGQIATNTGTSGTASTSGITPSVPNALAFVGVGIGTAAQTITPTSSWTNDSGQKNPTTPAGLYSFVSLSQFLANINAVTPQATFTSEPWAIAAATFQPVILGIQGAVQMADGASITLGAIADVAVTSDVNGTLSAKLRGLVKVFGDVWDSVNHLFKVSLATLIAGEDQINNVLKTEHRSTYTQITASTLIKNGAGRIRGIFVSAASATPTIKVWDNTSAATTILIDTFTPVAGTYYNFGDDANAGTGIYVTISGTVSCTVFYN